MESRLRKSHTTPATQTFIQTKRTHAFKIKRKDTGETWIGTTDDLGRLVINTGTIVPKDELEASEAKCAEDKDQSADSALKGLVTVPLQTRRGQVKLILPEDMRAGDKSLETPPALAAWCSIST